MRILTAALTLIFLTSASLSAMAQEITEQQIEGVKQAVKAMPGGCTVETTNIELDNGGYDLEQVVCEDGVFSIYLDEEFKVKEKLPD